MLLSLYDKTVKNLLRLESYRAWVWRIWYPYVTRLTRDADIIFLNYALYTNSEQLSLEPQDEANRLCINLYHHVLGNQSINQKTVLEVSCGHGGGAAFFSHYFKPKHYVAVDLNQQGIRFCQQRHRFPNLFFLVANAQALPCTAESLDYVINVEASHCYPDFAQFLQQVWACLKPGGYFLYADFRPQNELTQWRETLLECGFTIEQENDITRPVVAGMRANTEKYELQIKRCFPVGLRWLARLFSGIEGSRIFNAMNSGELIYHSYCLKKTALPNNPASTR